jgi:uncharacterized membrane protein
MSKWTVLAAALAIAAYAAASHWLMLHAADRLWAVAAIVGPLLIGLSAAAWRRRHWPSLLLCAAVAAGLAAFSARGGLADLHRLYVLQYLAINGLLGFSFAITLRRGSTPLITRLASRVHQHFPPPMQAYTARLTRLWVAYFALMSLLCLALYLWAPWSWWSLFANLLTPLVAVGVFAGEHLLRYRIHPDFERVSIVQTVRAYRQASAGGIVR